MHGPGLAGWRSPLALLRFDTADPARSGLDGELHRRTDHTLARWYTRLGARPGPRLPSHNSRSAAHRLCPGGAAGSPAAAPPRLDPLVVLGQLLQIGVAHLPHHGCQPARQQRLTAHHSQQLGQERVAVRGQRAALRGQRGAPPELPDKVCRGVVLVVVCVWGGGRGVRVWNGGRGRSKGRSPVVKRERGRCDPGRGHACTATATPTRLLGPGGTPATGSCSSLRRTQPHPQTKLAQVTKAQEHGAAARPHCGTLANGVELEVGHRV